MVDAKSPPAFARIDAALERIDAAMARIETARVSADTRHQRLRDRVTEAIAMLDEMMAGDNAG